MDISRLKATLADAVDLTGAFYLANVEDSSRQNVDHVEEAANIFLHPLRFCLTGFKGRKVTLHQDSYSITREGISYKLVKDVVIEALAFIVIHTLAVVITGAIGGIAVSISHGPLIGLAVAATIAVTSLAIGMIAAFFSLALFLALMLIVCTLVGTILKAYSWATSTTALERSRRFIQLERQEERQAVEVAANAYKSAEVSEFTLERQVTVLPKDVSGECNIQKLAPGVIAHIASYLKPAELQSLRSTSLTMWFYCRDNWRQHKVELIEALFPADAIDAIGIEHLIARPALRLPFHQFNDRGGQIWVRRYRSTEELSLELKGLQSKDLGNRRIRWGTYPKPFIAIQGSYRKETFFSTLAHQCDLTRHRWFWHKGVYTLTFSPAGSTNIRAPSSNADDLSNKIFKDKNGDSIEASQLSGKTPSDRDIDFLKRLANEDCYALGE